MSAKSGEDIARLLRGCWRAHPGITRLPPERATILATLLDGSGAGHLAARRWSGGASPDVVRQNAMRFALYREAIGRTAAIVEETAGRPPLLFKGFSAARRYAEPSSRPIGDIDLCAPPGAYADICEVLRARSLERSGDTARTPSTLGLTLDVGLPYALTRLDLHADLAKFSLAPIEDLYARGHDIAVNDARVRVLRPTDEIALLALHFLRHGGARPSWLCDIAALVENEAAGIDWGAIRLGPVARDNQIGVVCRLAGDLLGADLSAAPAWVRDHSPPEWLVRTTLKHWGRPFSSFSARPSFRLVLSGAGDGFLREIAARWPDPITASAGRMGKVPRFQPLTRQAQTFMMRAVGALSGATPKAASF